MLLRILTETFTKTILLKHLEIPGLRIILYAAKTELDFSNLLFSLDLSVDSNDTN